MHERINRGEFLPGAKLPSENDLAQSCGVNRLTMRRGFSAASANDEARHQVSMSTVPGKLAWGLAQAVCGET
ncbi:GntR family transcriptional regulator [Saccharopolyspora soli]|uniref:GntR family transcriptional regulator n=1 Tax=Saccharopolyspora soli TaxID=2926618 RepID=UPI0024133102|nr:GntR family transcriptional regulator [Saccharopolyspora soli]